MEFTHLIGGIDFGEGPRWHNDVLWYSDFYQGSVFTVTTAGERQEIVSLDDRPSGLGWLPDGDLLIVCMQQKKVCRWDGAALNDYADLSLHAAGYCNDMVVGEDGTAYVGNFGFDFEGGGEFAVAPLLGVRLGGEVFVASEGLAFPNGSVITPDGRTLIVGESFGQGYKAFDIGSDGSLFNMRQWATVEGTAPDGCSLDADGGIWFSDALGKQVVRIIEGGTITHQAPTPDNTYACALGGPDGCTLFVLTAPGTHPDEVTGTGAGAIYTATVDVPHAGRP